MTEKDDTQTKLGDSTDATATIRGLLGQGAEFEKLDYKKTLDISDKHSLVEITKDIAAMLSTEGGFILVGADDVGKPVADFTDDLFDNFDETKIRNGLKKYIAEPINIKCSLAKVDGFNHLLIECFDYPNGFVIMKVDGQYHGVDGKLKMAFRQGEVYVRHGSASERWEQHDISRILQREIDHAKSDWLQDAEKIMLRLGIKISGDPVEELNALKAVTREFRSKMTNKTLNVAQIEQTLNEVTGFALRAVEEDSKKLFDKALESLVEIYKCGFDSRGNWKMDGSFKPVDLWYQVLIRIPIIGGYCISQDKFIWAQKLILQKVPGDDARHYRNWYRHAFTISARDNRFVSESGYDKNSVLLFSTNLAITNPQFQSITQWTKDDALVFGVQLDYFASLVAIDDIQEVNTDAFYTSFAHFDKENVFDLMVRTVLDENVRKQIFKSSLEELAFIIDSIDDIASREGWMSWHKGQWPYGLRELLVEKKPLPIKF